MPSSTPPPVGADYDYVVLGAGPAGLAAAGHIAKAGKRVAIFEYRPRPEEVFGSYAVVLNARGMDSLETLDPQLPSKARDTGLNVKETHIVPNNRTVAKVKSNGTCIMRDQVAKLLLDSCEARENISIFWQHKLKSIDVTGHACTFTSPEGEDVVVTDVAHLVAADGNRSLVRRACEEQVEGFSAEVSHWGFQMRFMKSRGTSGQTELDPSNHYVLGEKGYACMQPNGDWLVSLRVLPGLDADFLTAEEATEERVQRLRAYVQEYAKACAENILVDDEAYRGWYGSRTFEGWIVKCSCLNPARWICLVGDAAHAVQPATGEGINAGLEDAKILGTMIVQHPDDPFGNFDRVHRADTHALHAIAQERGKMLLASKRDAARNTMITIGLGIGKKCGCIRPQAIQSDYKGGEKARACSIKPYAELLALDRRQKRFLRPLASCCVAMCCLSAAKPGTKVSDKINYEAEAAHSISSSS